MKTVLRIVAVLVLLAAAAAGWAGYEAWTFLKTPPATPGQEAFFDVEPGANVRRVADKLEERGLITDARKFLLLARYKKWDSRLQAGRFALNTGWLPEQVLDTLVNGQPVLFRVTVPEGLTWWQTAKVLEEAGLVRFEDFRAVITDPAFLRHYGIPFDSAEGFLMPDTYLLKKADVPDKAQARAVAGRMVDNFWRKGDALWPDGKRPSRDELRRLVTAGYQLQPIMSENAYTTDTRFGKARDFESELTKLCGRPVIHTIRDAEPLGPKLKLDLLAISPCTGNTLAKLAHGITDTPVTMAVKAHSRTGRPVLLAPASNDALSANLQNLALLSMRKNFFLVPMRQDDPCAKPSSLVADFSRIPDAFAAAREGKQLRPLFL